MYRWALLFLALLFAAVAGPADAQQHTCVLTISLIDDVQVNNLDFNLLYGSADGEIEGSGSNADCVRALTGNGIIAVNDKDDIDRLEVAVVQLTAFSGPVTMLGCRFFYDTEVPTAADFSIVVTNAGVGGEDDNVRPLPKVKVTNVACPGTLPLTTTTLGETTTTTTTLPSSDVCGVVVSGGVSPTASDALAALASAVGVRACDPCNCDADGNGSVTATDALLILRAAVGSPSNLDCPPCV
ncbi:MAG TPA: hypothetical protein VEC57_16815 [Candidatus Limnocylindrales bacterium]|nr:hypothetical protein [Candidatus Limnocylindrales bacterium]